MSTATAAGRTLQVEPYSEEWLEVRRGRITSTDVPAILGVSKEEGCHKTAYEVYARITGRIRGDKADTPEMRWGRESEGLNARLYSLETNRLVVRGFPKVGLIEDPEWDWLLGTPDGYLPGENGDGIWEAKAPSQFTRMNWDERIPLAYQIQVSVTMNIRKLHWASISALVQPGVLWRDIDYSEKFVSAMRERLLNFWEKNIKRDIPPSVEASDRKLIGELHQPVPWKTIVLSPALTDLCFEIKSTQAQIDALEEQVSKHKATIQQAMQQEQAEKAVSVAGELSCTFKVSTVEMPPKPAYSFQRSDFRINLKKGAQKA